MSEDVAQVKRLHVSGIPKDLSGPEELSNRFSSFGHDITVQQLPSENGYPRSYVFINISTTPQKLTQCMNLLSGSKWRGSVMRIAEARPDYRGRLEKEWTNVTANAQSSKKKKHVRKKRRQRYESPSITKQEVVNLENHHRFPGWVLSTSVSTTSTKQPSPADTHKRLYFPISMRPDHPIFPSSSKSKHALTQKSTRVPSRAWRKKIDPTHYGSTHTVGNKTLKTLSYKLAKPELMARYQKERRALDYGSEYDSAEPSETSSGSERVPTSPVKNSEIQGIVKSSHGATKTTSSTKGSSSDSSSADNTSDSSSVPSSSGKGSAQEKQPNNNNDDDSDDSTSTETSTASEKENDDSDESSSEDEDEAEPAERNMLDEKNQPVKKLEDGPSQKEESKVDGSSSPTEANGESSNFQMLTDAFKPQETTEFSIGGLLNSLDLELEEEEPVAPARGVVDATPSAKKGEESISTSINAPITTSQRLARHEMNQSHKDHRNESMDVDHSRDTLFFPFPMAEPDGEDLLMRSMDDAAVSKMLERSWTYPSGARRFKRTLNEEEIESQHGEIQKSLTAQVKKRHREASRRVNRRNATSMGFLKNATTGGRNRHD